MSVQLKAKVQYTPRGDGGRFIEARVTRGAIASVAAAQGLIVQEAKTLVPVRTGFLRDSIHSIDPQETGKTVVGNVTADAHYAFFVEFGTVKMAAQPYLRPALDTTREAVRSIFASNLSVELKT